MTVRLANLLWVDDQYQITNALPDAFGDRYLMSMNSVFSNIRASFHKFGFRYSADGSQLWKNYNVAPLFCLQNMIDEGAVPYTDNVATLRQVLSKSSELATTPVLLVNLVKRNYLLHESAHLVAHEVIQQQGSLVSLLCTTKRQEFVLKALICEAFANTVETIAAAHADSDTHRFFFLFNSYVEYSLISKPLLRRAALLFDMRCVFRFAFFTFLFQNACGCTPTDLALDCYTDLAFGNKMPSERDRLLLKLLSQKVFQLNVDFVKNTSPIFFRLHGCEDEFRQFGRCRFLTEEIHSLGLVPCLEKLVDIALGAVPEHTEVASC